MALSTRDMLLILRAQDVGSSVLRGFGNNIGTLTGQARQAAQQQMALGGAISTVGVGMAAVGGIAIGWLKGAIDQAKEFDKEVALVKTQVDNVKVSQQQLAAVTTSVAKNIAAPIEQLNSSLYDIFSSMDVTVAQSQDILTGFAKSAVAGQVDVQTAGRATIAVLNAWHLPASDVNKVLDVQFELVKKGVGTYQEFASTIGQAIPSAQRAGQTFQTLAGMVAYLTRNGLSAAMASASAQRALDAFANPKVVQRLQDMGISVTDSSGNFRDFTLVVTDLQKKMENLTAPQKAAALQELFKGAGGTIQARRFYDTIVQSSAAVAQYTGLVNNMKNSSGALDAAYGTMSGTVASKTQLLTNQYQLLKISVGNALMPVLTTLIPLVQGLINWWNGLSESTQKVITWIVAGTAALFLVGGVILFVVGTFIMLAGAAALADIALAPIILVVLAVVAAIALLAVGAFLLYKNWDTVSKAVMSVWTPVVRALGAAWNWLWNTILKPLVTWIWTEIGGRLTGLWKKMSSDVGNFLHGIGNDFRNGFNAVSGFVGELLHNMRAWFNDHFGAIKTTVKIFADWFAAVWPYLRGIFANALNLMVSIWQNTWGMIVGIFKAIWGTVVGVFHGVWDIISGVVRGIIDVIEGMIGFVVDIFSGRWDKAWKDIEQIFKGFWEIIQGVVKGAWEIIAAIFTGAWKIIAAIVTAIWKDLAAVFGAGVRDVRLVWDGFVAGLEAIWRTVWHGITSFFDTIISHIKSSFQTAVQEIGILWALIKGQVAAPINFVIRYVYNDGIRWLWNKIADFVGLGELPAAQPISFATGGYTGNGGKYDPAGIVHAGEFVFTKEQVEKIGVSNLYSLASVLAGYASGGIVHSIGGIGPGFNPPTGSSGGSGGGLLGQLISWAGGAAANVTSWLTDPVKAIEGSLGKSSQWIQAAGKIPAKAISGMLKKLWSEVSNIAKSAVTGTATGNVLTSYPQEVGYAMSLFPGFGWGQNQIDSLIKLWNQESGWNPNAVNKSSGAYGIPQALGHGHPYNLGDFVAQIQWGLNYIKGRYGSPIAAWAHEMANNWYDVGGMVPQGTSVVHNGTGSNEHMGIFTSTQWNVLQNIADKGSNPLSSTSGNVYYITVQGINIYTNEIDPRQHSIELGQFLTSVGGVH